MNNQTLATENIGKLVVTYPKPEYWTALFRQVSAMPGFAGSPRHRRWKTAFGDRGFDSAGDYMALAEQALQAGLPAEAKTVIEKGYAAGFWASARKPTVIERLRELAARQTADDLMSLRAAQREAERQTTGLALVNTGMECVFLGQSEQGVALIERGLARGGLKHPEDAWLHLGEAQVFAGQVEKARAAFRKVDGPSAARDLARFWLIHLKTKPAPGQVHTP